MKKQILLISVATLLLSACSTTPTDPNWRPDMTTANFGKYPTNYPEIVQKWGNNNLDNPKSVTYLAISSPRMEYIVTNSEKQEATFGYSVCADISGMKTTNYYKPISKHWFFIRDGKVIEQRNLDYGYNHVIYRDHKVNCDDAS
ncbi:hypothetical protein [Zophobihabitans entericus]|uniref:Lipoprotein n=1 Tax=Zophobihabitans entericus TaxID=1635327 RepID=A0A6G9ICP3_9GAMM|nr:hypothetical protein [Zophobihabitans entericus]QIQ21993.1 hypothetical protein IPMB12_10035 [Zophobihabitans entericus]